MKKLMVAIAAAATAFGLYAADDPGFKSGTGFDSMAAGAKTLAQLNTDDAAEGTGGTWSQADGVGAEVKAWVSSEKLGEAYRPDQYANNITQVNYLWVTNSLEKPLTRTMTGDAMSLATADAYVDTLVKFTACDEEITTLGDAEAKIAVWVREDEEAGTTNLMITAGKILAADGSVQQQNYDCGSFDGVDAWHRLTIKAIGNIAKSDIGLVGFVVFIDGNVTDTAKFSTADKGYDGYKTILNDVATLWDKNGQLFPSLRGKADGSISALAVAGQGGIDDISFTTTAPTWANKAAATITWDTETVAWVSIDDGATQVTTGSIVVEANKLVTITAEAKDDYMITSGTGEWTPAAGGTQTVVASKIAATVEIGGVTTTYADLAQAIYEINIADGKAKLTLGDSMAGFALDTLETAEVTIDLNGKTITAAEENYGIWDEGFGLLIIIDPIGGGVVDGTAGNGSVGSSLGVVTLNAGTFKGAALGVTTVANGVKGDEAAKGSIDCLDGDQQWSEVDEDGLYTVIEIETFEVEVVAPTAGSHVALSTITVDGKPVELPVAGKYDAEKSVEVVYALDNGYKLAESSAPLTQSFTAADSTTVPTAEAETYTITYEFTGVDEADKEKILNSNPETYTVESETITFTAPSCEGYTFNDDLAPASIEKGSTGNVTVKGSFKKNQQAWPENPSEYKGKQAKDIPGVTLPTELEKVDGETLITWATGVGAVDFAAADTIKTEAFLLNIVNSSDDAAVQAEKAAFKITEITQKEDGSWDVDAVKTNLAGNAYNGQVVIKGSETLEDPEWDASNVEGPFFKAFLEIVTVPDVE